MRLLLVVLLFLSTACFAQGDSLFQYRLAVKVAPLSPFMPYYGNSIRAGVDYRVNEKVAIVPEAGFFFYNGTGVCGRLELRFYRWMDAYGSGADYFSGELFYKYQDYTVKAFVDTADPYEQNYIVAPEFNVTKNVECLTFKYGYQQLFRFGLVTDVFCGLGIRFQQTKNSLTPEENAWMEPTSDYGPNLILNQERNRIYPNLVVGVRLGWRILK